MRFILLGPPGSGKGSLAKALTRRIPLVHLSTGDLFRNEINLQTPIGRAIKGRMARGELVSDEMTIQMVENVLSQPDAAASFLLDGFPRNIAQAEALTAFTKDRHIQVDAILHVHVPDEIIIKRVAGRRVCEGCGHIYNIYAHRPRHDGHCDYCEAMVTQRKDDDEAIIRSRLETYHGQTEPLLAYYQGLVPIWDIDNTGALGQVVDRVLMQIQALEVPHA